MLTFLHYVRRLVVMKVCIKKFVDLGRNGGIVIKGFEHSINASLDQQSWGFYKSERIIKIGVSVQKLSNKM